MKDYIQQQAPEVHRSYKKLRAVVLEAWNSITHERIIELVRTIEERCLDVILADGWHIKW